MLQFCINFAMYEKNWSFEKMKSMNTKQICDRGFGSNEMSDKNDDNDA